MTAAAAVAPGLKAANRYDSEKSQEELLPQMVEETKQELPIPPIAGEGTTVVE